MHRTLPSAWRRVGTPGIESLWGACGVGRHGSKWTGVVSGGLLPASEPCTPLLPTGFLIFLWYWSMRLQA